MTHISGPRGINRSDGNYSLSLSLTIYCAVHAFINFINSLFISVGTHYTCTCNLYGYVYTSFIACTMSSCSGPPCALHNSKLIIYDYGLCVIIY